jgi:hypothetical protein
VKSKQSSSGIEINAISRKSISSVAETQPDLHEMVCDSAYTAGIRPEKKCLDPN